MSLSAALRRTNLCKSAKYCLILQQTWDARQETADCVEVTSLWRSELRWYHFVSDLESETFRSAVQPVGHR